MTMKKEEGKIVVAHDDIRHLIDIIHYDDHPSRTESPEFIAIRKAFHDAGAKCLIDNGYCEGHIEIHHGEIEYSTSTEIDWERVMKDLGFDHVDDNKQMQPLCHKHHMGVGTGKHMITDPAWKLQKYLKPAQLALFEAAVAHIKAEKHPNHADPTHDDHRIVNAKATAILKTLAASQIEETKV
jgi:hypothetical protein